MEIHLLQHITPFLGYLTAFAFIGFLVVCLLPAPDRLKLIRALGWALAVAYINLLHDAGVCIVSATIYSPPTSIFHALSFITHLMECAISIGLVIIIQTLYNLAKKAIRRWLYGAYQWMLLNSGVFLYKKHTGWVSMFFSLIDISKYSFSMLLPHLDKRFF